MISRSALRRAVRTLLAVAAVALLVLALVSQFAAVRDRIGELSWVTLAVAMVAGVGGMACSMAGWRAVLAGLGSPLPLRPAARIFFLGQLAKYLPGSVWSVLAQVELGRERDISRARSAAAAGVILALSLVAALMIALVTLALFAVDTVTTYWWAFAMLPAALLVLHPRVVNAVLNRLLRLARRAPLEQPLSSAGVLGGTAWSALSWVLFGTQVWLLCRDLGATEASAFPLAVGGFALAWVAGFLVLFAPAGAGVREAVLVVALAPVLPVRGGGGLLVALVSRLLLTLADLLWGCLALRVREPDQRGALLGPDRDGLRAVEPRRR